MNKSVKPTLNEKTQELNQLYQKIDAINSFNALNEIEGKFSKIKKQLGTLDLSYTEKNNLNNQYHIFEGKLEKRHLYLEDREKYISYGKKIEAIIGSLAKIISIKKDDSLNQLIPEILRNSDIQTKLSTAKISPAIAKQLEKLRSFYQEFAFYEKKLKTFLGEANFSMQFDDKDLVETNAYLERLKIASQITNSLIMRLILDKTLPVDMLFGEGASLKTKWLNEFMKGKTPDLKEKDTISMNTQTIHFIPPGAQVDFSVFSDSFLKLIFPGINKPILDQLMRIRKQEVLISEIKSAVLQGILRNNSFFAVSDAMVTEINELYEKFEKTEINSLAFRKAFEKITVQKEEAGYVLTAQEIAQLVPNNPKSVRESTNQFDSILEAAQSIKKFFSEKITEIPVQRRFAWQKLKSKHDSEKILEYSPEKIKDEIAEKISSFLIFETMRRHLKENKDLFPGKEWKQIDKAMHESKYILVKFLNRYVDYLLSESRKIERNIQRLEKIPLDSSEEVHRVLTTSKLHIDQLQEYFTSLSNVFPKTFEEHEALSNALKRVYQKTDQLSEKLSQQTRKISKMLQKMAPVEEIVTEQEKIPELPQGQPAGDKKPLLYELPVPRSVYK